MEFFLIIGVGFGWEFNCFDFFIKILFVFFLFLGFDMCIDEVDEVEDIDVLWIGEGDCFFGGDGDFLVGFGDGDFFLGFGEGDFFFLIGDGDLFFDWDFVIMIFLGVLDFDFEFDELDDELKIKGLSWIKNKICLLRNLK